MNKFILILVSGLLVVLLCIGAVLLYAFSENGNTRIKHLIQNKLEEKTGLPVEVHSFKLSPGKSKIDFSVSKQARVNIVTQFDLLSQRFKGIYHIKANDFTYSNKILRELNVTGQFKGKMSNVSVEGKGTALDAVLAYRFSVLKEKPKNIEVIMKGVSLDELLVLAGQAPMAKGKMDIDIHMPEIGNEFANGYGHIVLHKALFDVNRIKKMYDLVIPKESFVTAKIDVQLKGDTLFMGARAKSNLFTLNLHDVAMGIKENNVTAKYAMDVKEMAILTQNKLAGALNVEGKITGELKEKNVRIEGTTRSLGGVLSFDIAEHSSVHLQDVDLEKIHYLLKETPLVTGRISANASLGRSLENGNYMIHIEKGQFVAKNIEKKFGYILPASNHFTMDSMGKIAQKVLKADATLISTLGELKLTQINYDIEHKKLRTDYDVFMPNIGLLIPNNKAVKRGYMRAKGKLDLDKTLKVQGEVKGLGEKLAFEYSTRKVILHAENLFIEKLLSLANMPRYVKGKLSSDIEISDVEHKNGTFSIVGHQLLTQPQVMERVMEKKLVLELDVISKGVLKEGIAKSNSHIKTTMGEITLTDTLYDSKNAHLSSKYLIDIPKLEKTYALTEKKLYGSLRLVGDIEKDKILKIRGHTDSLGGNIDYTLIDNTIKSTIKKVPLDTILFVFGQGRLVEGDAYGTVNYDLQKESGSVDIDIKSFRIKPNSTTQTIKMFIGKDPARIIYSSTKLHAKIEKEITRYTLTAKGTHSNIEVSKGILDKKHNTHRARFKFVYDKYEVTGRIGGSIDKPQIMVDPSSVMQSKTGEKIQKKLDRALGKDMGKAVGGFLKGLKF